MDRIHGPWSRDDGHGVATDNDHHEERDDTCVMPDAPPTTTTVALPVGGGSVAQTVTVVVPPLVRVQSDADGVLRVVTNASRPPAPGDNVYRLQADGNYAPADEPLVSRVMTARWADGSWCSTTAEHHSVG